MLKIDIFKGRQIDGLKEEFKDTSFISIDRRMKKGSFAFNKNIKVVNFEKYENVYENAFYHCENLKKLKIQIEKVLFQKIRVL